MMPIFGFGKKEEKVIEKEEKDNSFVRKSVISENLDEFNDEFKEINMRGITKNIPNISVNNSESPKLKDNLLDKQIDDYVNKHFSEENFETDANKSLLATVMLDEIGLTPETKIEPITPIKAATTFKEKNNNENIFSETSKSTLNINIANNNNIAFSEKKVEPKDEKKEFSTIMSLAISRPIDVAYDLKDRYAKEPYERLDMRATNQDLMNYVNKNSGAKYLDISNCQSITNYSLISKLSNLEELDLSDSQNLQDISFLKNLKNLRVLNLGITSIESLENLPKLPNLEVLNLKMTKIKSLSGIESCPNLHELILWGCTALENINELANFTEMRSLDLEACGTLRNISPIVNMKKLVYLNLNYTRIEDLTPIKNLTNLEIFTMDSSLALSEQNLACFDNLVKMKFLGLRNRVIRDLSHFKNMTKMGELELNGNAISDLRPLENMTELQILNLSTNPSLTDLSPLHKMKKLKKLIINGAKAKGTITIPMLIEDISVIKEFESLEVLESKFNKKIKDISALQYCKNLEEVHLNDCFGVEDVTPLIFCKNLKEIHLENCTQIRDLSFVKYLKKLEKITLAKTSANRLFASEWTNLLNIQELNDSGGTLPIHKMILDSIKFRKKISKIAKKTIKEEN